MKNRTYRSIFGFFLAAMVLIASCKKEDPIKLDPKLATWEIANITSTTADVSGFVVAEGDGFTERGIVWGISEQPTEADNKAMVDTVKGAVYTAQATGMEFLTKYYVRAYAKSASGTILYGEDATFTTLANVPFLNVDAATDILANTATSGGVVTDNGKATVTAKGICWSMEENPTIENDSTVNGAGNDAFTSDMTGLVGAQTYYVRAYATNEMGTGYSDQVSFTTLAGVPVVSTDSVTDVTKFTAIAYANALFTGGQDITERGFCWALTENPTTADDNIASGSGLGEYTSDIVGLASGKEYHIRAYVTNSIGTSYGDDLTFSTIPDEYFLVGSVNGWDNHGLYLANLGNDVHVGYQYLTGSDEFKIFPQRDSWDNGWGRDGSNPGTVVSGGGNIKTSDEPTFTGDGFYEIKFDLANGTVALTTVDMGVIGDAIGSWDNDINLTYNQGSKKWEGQVDYLDAPSGYKFRANDGWDINFGGDLNNLTHGGANITTPGAGTWNVTLDISGVDGFSAMVSQYPNAMYIVGDATSYGWDTPGTSDAALMHKLAGGSANEGIFWKICYIESGKGFKLSAENWGDPNIGFGEVDEFDANGVTVSDNGGNMSIATSGMYMVVVNLQNGMKKVSVITPSVYGIGDAFGSWDSAAAANLFTVDDVAKTLTSPALSADGNIRMYVDHAWIPDWWNAEFNVYSGVIEYRNDGGDQAAVAGTTGQVITLTFDDNTAAIN